jgi:hypothetical protein
MSPTSTRTPPGDAAEENLGTVQENLEGWVPPVTTDEEIRVAVEKAFDYRGDVTITLKDGRQIEGYVYDRKLKGPAPSDCVLRLMPKNEPGKLSVLYSEIAALAFTGRDSAAGKSFAAWVKKYHEKKAKGEKNIGIQSEPLD